MSPHEAKRYQLILQVQAFIKEGCRYREIAKRLCINTKTVYKYITGNPLELCKSGINQSKLDAYREEIYKCLDVGYSKSKTVMHLYSLGYNGAKSTAFDYLVRLEILTEKSFTQQPYIRTYTETMKYKTGSKGKNADY